MMICVFFWIFKINCHNHHCNLLSLLPFSVCHVLLPKLLMQSFKVGWIFYRWNTTVPFLLILKEISLEILPPLEREMYLFTCNAHTQKKSFKNVYRCVQNLSTRKCLRRQTRQHDSYSCVYIETDRMHARWQKTCWGLYMNMHDW